MEAFAVLERTAASVFVRESLWLFPAALVAHALGMAAVVGPGLAVALRILGVARAVPLAPFARLSPVMQAGLALATVSGLALLLAYPAKALTNPVFYLKLALLAAAGALTWLFARRLLRASDADAPPAGWARPAALLAIALWAGAITAGRLLAYTHTVLLVSR